MTAYASIAAAIILCLLVWACERLASTRGAKTIVLAVAALVCLFLLGWLTWPYLGHHR